MNIPRSKDLSPLNCVSKPKTLIRSEKSNMFWKSPYFFLIVLIQNPDNNVYLGSIGNMQYSLMVEEHVKKMCSNTR